MQTSETLTFALAAGTLEGQVLWVHVLIAESLPMNCPADPAVPSASCSASSEYNNGYLCENAGNAKPEVSSFKDKLNMFQQASQERLKKTASLPLPDRVMALNKDAAGKTIPAWKLVVQQEHLDKAWGKKKKVVEQQNIFLALPAWKRAKMERSGSLPDFGHPLDARKAASKKAPKSARSSKTSSPVTRTPRPATAPTKGTTPQWRCHF